MDTTPIYKKQCKAAFKDIGFIWNEGPDNMLIVDDDELLITPLNSKEKIEHFHGQLFTIYGQLYRQDQLQKVLDYPHVDIVLLETFYRTVCNLTKRNQGYYYYYKFNSMEQLWLAFVMYEKFGKTWDGNKWVKEG